VLRSSGGSTAGLSISGTLAYVPSPDLRRRSLVWIAADGTQTDAKFGQRQFKVVNLSLDGRRVAVASDDHDGTAWDVGDSSGGALTPVGTSQGRTAETQWNPDGNSLGRQSVVRMASLSSDGRRLAYESNESGPFEIYVQAYPLPAGRLKVSRAGGTKARWAKSSDQLFFISGSTLMVSTVTAHPDLRSDVPRPVVNEPLLAQDGAIRQYDVAPDDRILAIKRGRQRALRPHHRRPELAE
jgi:Tol biopolymer transport system component